MKNHLHIKRSWVNHPGEDGRHLVVARWEWDPSREAEGREERETVGWETLLPVPVGEAGWEPDNVNYDYNDNGWEPLVRAGRHQKTLSTAILLVRAVPLGLACVVLDLHKAMQ